MAAISPNFRNTIDQEVYKWVAQQNKKSKVVTPNAIRQKAYEIGQEYDPNFKASLNWYNNWKKRYEYNESPEAEALKHKKRSYTAAFKLQAVQRAMELESASQASLELNVSRRCLQRWKEELDVIASVAEHSSNAVYRRPGQGRKVHDSSLDTQLLEWLQECWKQGINVTSSMVRDKARELSSRSDFKASLGWFVKWQKRHNVDLKEQLCGSPVAEGGSSPLKLRLLPEGELSCYSTPGSKRKTKKRKLSYDDEALLENDEEFDRQLLTWLVERWEAGDIVNDRMLKDRAMELTANPEFKAAKAWLFAWKRKYNVSLENQTYGNEGDEENEEIIEETEVYDNEHLTDDQAMTSQDTENPLTPTKEEAATTLASLSAEDAAGLEVAEALQKLANALGIATQGGDAAKEAMAQLTAAYQADNPEFLLEGSQVAAEEVISEEVITDEPMVVIETGPGLQEVTVQTTSVAPTQTVSQTINNSLAQDSSTITTVSQPQVAIPSTQVSRAPASGVVSTSPISSFVTEVTEEVVIGEPVIETSMSTSNQVEVILQGGDEGIVVVPTEGENRSSGAEAVISTVASSSISPAETAAQQLIAALSDMTSQQTSAAVTLSYNNSTSSAGNTETPSDVDIATQQIIAAAEDNTSELAALESDIIAVAVQQSADPGSSVKMQEMSLPVSDQDIMDLVEKAEQKEGEVPVVYDDDFKAKVVSRAQELGSVQLAAREFSVPWKAVATWKGERKE